MQSFIEFLEREEADPKGEKCPKCGASAFRDLGYMACMLVSRCENCGFIKQTSTGSCG